MLSRKGQSGAGFLGIMILIIVFGSCQNEKKHIISEKKFVNFLVDLNLAESIGTGPQSGITRNFEIDSASLYGSVFRKYGVSQADFDSTMTYYSRRPLKFQEIYNSVTARLKTMEMELSLKLKEEEKNAGLLIWQSDAIYRFPPLRGEKIPVNITLSGPGVYIVTATVKIMPDDNTLDPRMSLYFFRNDSTGADSIDRFMDVRYISRNGDNKIYRAVKEMDSTKVYTSLRGFISNYSNSDSMFNRNMTISEIRVSKK